MSTPPLPSLPRQNVFYLFIVILEKLKMDIMRSLDHSQLQHLRQLLASDDSPGKVVDSSGGDDVGSMVLVSSSMPEGIVFGSEMRGGRAVRQGGLGSRAGGWGGRRRGPVPIHFMDGLGGEKRFISFLYFFV